MNCALFRRHVEVWLDGELDPAAQIDFERHADACASCQELMALETSFRGQLRESLSDVEVPESLFVHAFDKLRAAETVNSGHVARSIVEVRHLRWGQAWPFAAAAAAVVMIGTVVQLPADQAVQTASAIPDVLQLHSMKLPSDVPATQLTEPTAEQFVASKLGERVKLARFRSNAARLTGARISRVGQQHAPAFFYNVDGHRVTVVVLRDPRLVDGAQRRDVGGRIVMYQQIGGLDVPVWQQGDHSYVVWGDLDRETLFRLAASAVTQSTPGSPVDIRDGTGTLLQ